MRILLACEFYYPSVGGVQEVMRQLAERFAQIGHEVAVATTQLPERQARLITGVTVEEFRVSGNLVHGMRGEIERYREYVVRQDFDILMIKAAQQWTFDALIPVLDTIKKPKIFIPCGFSGMYDPLYASYFQQMPQWLRKFDRLIFYASDYRDINLARMHELKNINVLPNGADEREFNVKRDLAFRSRHAIPENAFVVMTVGSITGLKGHVELAEAFANCNLGEVPACLLLIGNTPRVLSFDEGWLVRMVRTAFKRWLDNGKTMYRKGGPIRVAKWMVHIVLLRLGLGWVLTFFGYAGRARVRTLEAKLKGIVERINSTKGRQAFLVDFPRSEVVQAYLNSNLFVFASNIEYSPLVLFEASAAGLPFLSGPVGNAAEIARWTGGGQICAANVDASGYTRVDPVELARHIELLAAQRDVLARMGSNGRQAWELRFSWNEVFRSYEKIFEECLQKTPA